MQVAEQVFIPGVPQAVVQGVGTPAQQPKPLSQPDTQSSSMPLQVSAGGTQAPGAQPAEQVRVPEEEHEVVHGEVAPAQQPKPLSHTVSQSSSRPLQVSAGA
jgi:hypothetical protein